MHQIDYIWGLLAIACAALPCFRLYDNLHRPGAPYLLGLVAVCALYPWAYVIYPHTVFDQGFVFTFTAWIGPLYLLTVLRFASVQAHRWPLIKNGMLTLAALMSFSAITNPLHGGFAQFAPVTSAEPITTTGQIAHGPMMTLMGGVSIACMLAALSVIGFLYSRARVPTAHLLALTVFPLAAGMSYLFQGQVKALLPDHINSFMLCTTAGLAVLSIAMLRSSFLEMRPISRELVLNLLPDAMAIVSDQGLVIDCNLGFRQLLQRTNRQTLGQPIGQLLPEGSWSLDGMEQSTHSMQMDAADGRRYFQVHLSALGEHAHHGETLILLRDITDQTLSHQALQANRKELQLLNEQLARLSTTDHLTGLRNRRYFMDRLNAAYERIQRNGRQLALLSIDLDDFKSVNDTYGHAIGDQALAHAARAMENQCRTTDTLARVGGEEFMVLLTEADPAQLASVAERFRLAIALAPMPLPEGGHLELSVSIGAAMIGPDDDVASALRQIDDALYHAKGSGRNRVATTST